MNFLDQLSEALFSGLGGGGSPGTSLLAPAGQQEAPKMPSMDNVGASGGPLDGLAFLGGLSGGAQAGGATGAAPLINAFRDAFVGGQNQLKQAPMPEPQAGPMGTSLPALAANPALQAAAGKALPVGRPAAGPPAAGMTAGGMTPDTKGAPYPEGPQKFMGMTGNDWRDVLKAVFTGAAGVDPRSPGLSAFAQGGAGTFSALDKQKAEATAAANAAEDRGWKREDRSIAADERQYKRTRETTNDARAARTAEVNNIAALTKAMKEIRGSTELTTDQKFKLNDQLYRFADKINKNGIMTTKELNDAIEKERDRLMSDYGVKKPGIPSGANASGAPDGTGRAANAGASKTAPATPTTKEMFDALPSGAWFVNPADGRVMQKK